MKLPRRQFLHLVAGCAALSAVSRIAWAQAYPTRPVRLIVPFGSAGATDITARLMGQWLSARLGQQFIIENRPGAGGNIGTEAVVRAPPDGHTLVMAGNFNAWNVTLYDKLSFNFLSDIAPIASIIRFPKCRKIKGTMQLRIASKRTNGGSILLAAELSKRLIWRWWPAPVGAAASFWDAARPMIVRRPPCGPERLLATQLDLSLDVCGATL
jgi:hypothetical protein